MLNAPVLGAWEKRINGRIWPATESNCTRPHLLAGLNSSSSFVQELLLSCCLLLQDALLVLLQSALEPLRRGDRVCLCFCVICCPMICCLLHPTANHAGDMLVPG